MEMFIYINTLNKFLVYQIINSFEVLFNFWFQNKK